MDEENHQMSSEYNDAKLCESVRCRPKMYFGSVDLLGLQNAIMDVIHHCIKNQKRDIGVVINGSDITIRHEGEKLASNFDIVVVESACETFKYENNQYDFRFDRRIFKIIEPNYDALFDTLRELAFLNNSLKIRLNEHDYHYENGLMDFYQYLKTRTGFYRWDKHPPISFYAKEGDMELDAVFAAVDSMDPCIFSFVNNQKTEDNGAHVDGFLEGLKEAAYKYKQNSSEYKNVIKRKDISLVIHIRTPNPEYYGSTKRKIANREVYQFVRKVTKEKLEQVFADNPNLALAYLKWWQYVQVP